MIAINRVTVAGNLTKDPELRYTNSGIPVCTIGIAINEKVKKGEEYVDEVTFLDKITFWQKKAEVLAEYLKKGDPILIEGKLRKNSWETESGEKRSMLEITGLQFHFLTSKKKSGDSEVHSNEDLEPMKDDNVPF